MAARPLTKNEEAERRNLETCTNRLVRFPDSHIVLGNCHAEPSVRDMC